MAYNNTHAIIDTVGIDRTVKIVYTVKLLNEPRIESITEGALVAEWLAIYMMSG